MKISKTACVLTLSVILPFSSPVTTSARADDNEKEHGLVKGAATGAAVGTILPGVSAKTGAAVVAVTGGIKANNDKKDEAKEEKNSDQKDK
ncbi:hypothetical protein [Hyphomicrobium sp.]|uniref:hypothetical protein n=1 Tax=Hyphomicrobium sp. TaxID=82 RepID=UPI002E309E02|nr:hypothetical protein [Hyphomicrobium sp.]HEX2840520.1 hypothetical protein [Hyphomicrobium sp.]